MLDIAAGLLHTNFGPVALSKPKRVPRLALLLVRKCTDIDSGIERNRRVVEEKNGDTYTDIVQHQINTGDGHPIRL